MIETSLTLTATDYRALKVHLFPADGCEAVAIALCGRASGAHRHRLLVRRLFLVPYESCSIREPDRVTWPTGLIVPLLEEAAKRGLAIVKMHGHRGYDRFSPTDDISDRLLFPSIYAWLERDLPHASAILMEDGRMFGRVVTETGEFLPLIHVNITGDDLLFWPSVDDIDVPDAGIRIAQTFGKGTFQRLRRLRIGVVGCSGTGSVVIEQLARSCVGHLALVDPDVIEKKNLNRILNSTSQDAIDANPKVLVARRSIDRMGLGTSVTFIKDNLYSRTSIDLIAACDIVFGCVDSIDGRHLLNRLATFYLLPYFDLGVKIEADGQGNVDQVCGTVHYLNPGGSSLYSRGVYTLEQVRAAGLKRVDPDRYKALLEEGYIRGVQEDSPAVIQLNSLIASLAVNELLARLHPYRLDPNSSYAIYRISLSHGIYEYEPEGMPCSLLSRHVGRGDIEPRLDMPELSRAEI